MKRTIHIAMSLDGYIADRHGSIAWLEKAGSNPAIFERILPFITAADALVMGRISYEHVLGAVAEWPYPDKQTVVVSGTLSAPSSPNTRIVRIAELISALEATGAQRLWIVGGGGVNAYLLEKGWVDELIVTVVPILLGAGVPLFSGLQGHTALQLVDVHQLPDGFVELSYRPLAGDA